MCEWYELHAETGLGRLLVLRFHVQRSCLSQGTIKERVANGRRRDGTRSGVGCKRRDEKRRGENQALDGGKDDEWTKVAVFSGLSPSCPFTLQPVIFEGVYFLFLRKGEQVLVCIHSFPYFSTLPSLLTVATVVADLLSRLIPIGTPARPQ